VPKWIKALVGSLVFLAAVYGLLRIPRRSGGPLLPPAPKDISRISLAHSSFHFVFEKTDSGWRLREPLEFPAEEGAVGALLEGIGALAADEAVSKRAESHGLYEVTDEAGTRVGAWAPGAPSDDPGRPLAAAADKPVEWILGKPTPDGGGIYLRLPGHDEVYRATGLTRETVRQPLNNWRDRRVLSIQAEDEIREIRLGGLGAHFNLAKSSDLWTVDGRPARRDLAERVANELRYAAAEEFVDPPAALDLKTWGLTGLTPTIVLKLTSGKSVTLRFGKKELPGSAARVVVQREGEPTLYWVLVNRLEIRTLIAKDFLEQKK